MSGGRSALLEIISVRRYTAMFSTIVLGLAIILLLIVFLKLKRNWLLSILVIVTILFFFDLTLLLKESSAPKKPNIPFFRYSTSVPYMKKGDPILRYTFIPSTEVKETVAFDDGDVIYKDVLYSFDDRGRRVTPHLSENKQRHALFFGGSYMFGQGLTNGNTMPAHFSQLCGKKSRVINYGGGSYGTSAMHIQLDRDHFFDDINEEKGIAVYGFIPGHLTRSTGYKISVYLQAFTSNPVFDYNETTGSLTGPMRYADFPSLKRKIRNYVWLKKNSPLGRFIIKRYQPKFITEEAAVRTVAAIIVESNRKYAKRFNGDFYVIFWPRRMRNLSKKGAVMLTELLEANDITVVKVPDMKDKSKAVLHPKNSHPSSEENKWVATYLCKAIASKKGN